MTVEITFDEAKTLLERAIAEKGEDFVYTKPEGSIQCAFFEPGTGAPSCIVGYVASYKGITPHDLMLGGVSNNAVSGELVVKRLINASPKASALLRYTQRWQDESIPWGQALQKGLDDVAGYFQE